MSTKEVLKDIIDLLWEVETIEEIRDISNGLVNDILESTQAIIKIRKPRK